MPLDLEITLSQTFPNNSGELSLFDLTKKKQVIEQSGLTNRLVPSFWIGEKGLFFNTINFKDSTRGYLMINHTLHSDQLTTNQLVKDGYSVEMNKSEVLDFIKTKLSEGLVSAESINVTIPTSMKNDEWLKSIKPYEITLIS